MSDEPQPGRVDHSYAIANRIHDQSWEYSQKLTEAAINNGNAAIRIILLINGGAALALLAFVGSLISSDGSFASKLPALTTPLLWFAGGAALCAVTMVFAYLTNTFYACGSRSMPRRYDHPFVFNTPQSDRWYWWAKWCQYLAFAVTIFALVFYIVGMFQVRDAINHLNDPVSKAEAPKQ
jgi:hypothetical protein